MKYKITNVSDRGIIETFPGVFRFTLQPGESLIIEDIVVKGVDGKQDELYCAGELIRTIKQARGIRGASDIKFEQILNDGETSEVLKLSAFEDKTIPAVRTSNPVFNKEKK